MPITINDLSKIDVVKQNKLKKDFSEFLKKYELEYDDEEIRKLQLQKEDNGFNYEEILNFIEHYENLKPIYEKDFNKNHIVKEEDVEELFNKCLDLF